ncbi:hypothetical protein [Bdellovibrio sp. HCB337]|uniref:hypothetical protein n=1 Tax=Bdellovibrio sp. HCB337 TaxID=3394358 RepID=UPI0039A62C16
MFLQRFLFFALILFALNASAGVKVEYRINKMQGFLSFALANAGYPHLPGGLVEIFVKSSYNTDENKKTLATLFELQRSLHNSIEMHTETQRRHAGKNAMDLIVIQSVFAKDLKDLSTRTLGLLPVADHTLFYQELKKLEPIYDKLIWKKLSPELFQHKAELEKLAKEIKLNEMFAKTEKFYNAKWPENTPFVISLYPIPYIKDFQNGSNSQSLTSIETHGVIVGKGVRKRINLIGSFGVIFHELCHSVYDAQKDSFKLELENGFFKSSSPFALQAYTWLNESLATAIGNGWAYAKANNGKIDKEEWYNNPTIDGFAQEIYPVVSEALEKGQSLDDAMVTKFISAYEKRFPKAIYAFGNLLNRVIISHEGGTLKSEELRGKIKKSFIINSLNISAPIDHPKTVQTIVSHKDDNLLFVFSDKGQDQLRAVAKEVLYVNDHLKDLQKMKNRSILAGLAEDGRAFIFVKADTSKDWEDSIASLSQKAFIDPQQKIWSY